MWHRKPDAKANASTNSVARSFTVRTRANANKANSASALASAARRSRDPPQAMNVSAFLRCVIASSKEDLAAEHDDDDEHEEDEESEREAERTHAREAAGPHTCSDDSDYGSHDDEGADGDDSDDDNLHELLAMKQVCDMLGRAQVSSEEDGDAHTRQSAGSGRRKARTTETFEIFLFPQRKKCSAAADNGGNSDTCEAEAEAETDTQSPSQLSRAAGSSWLGTPSGSFGTSTAACDGPASAPMSSTAGSAPAEAIPPALSLHRSTAKLKRKVRALREARSNANVASATSNDEDTSTALARQRRREGQRLLLRRALSGRLSRKTSVESLSPLSVVPHSRFAAKSIRIKRGKRDRSATKKEQPDTPRDHAEEVVIRKTLGSANRRYLIPRVRRTQHFNLHVVLDLDETLVSARNGPILVRPYVGHLIQTLMDLRCEIILWTAGIPQYVANIIAGLTMAIQGLSPEVYEQERPPWVHHLIQRNNRWYDEDKVCVKDLSMLGRPMDRLLIIENNPAAVQLQVSNAVLVQDYVVENYNDRSLEVVSRIVSRCARSIDPVSVSLASDPELLFVEFNLAAEHSADGMPIRPVEYGLKYSPPGTTQREHAGETPSNVIDKE